MATEKSVDYKCVQVKHCKDFHDSVLPLFEGVMGPIGSGKSTACIIELLKKS
jgi:pantothenate kinase-related protein Tda10